VSYKEVSGKLYYLRYKVEDSDKYIVVATTRPETIMGDTAVCINPNDERYQLLKGKKVVVPLVNRAVPIIMDEYVDMGFGTGCLKVTPAHDVNDYMLGEKYNLEVIDILEDNGAISPQAGIYVGMDRFDVRRQMERDLEEAGLMEKVEPYVNKVGYSERTDVPVEPKLSTQWFLRMAQLAQPALKAVMTDGIRLHPAKFKNTYRHWMENVKDWCISRQLWWGHRIPAYFLPEGGYVVAETAQEALEQAKQKLNNPSLQLSDLRQDEDVLDTWFSSWLWPISVFDGVNEPDNPDIQYYYPTDDLVTAPEILFFWVARMIISGYEYRGQKCFSNVYLTGIVRDKLGRKMSKSLGNSPEPLELIDKYGADGVRLGMLLSSSAGNDLPFDEALCEQGRNFCNKIWNAFRLVKGWTYGDAEEQPLHARVAIDWFNALVSKTIENVSDDFSKYRLSEALMELYKLYWDEFSGWYLEIVKPLRGKSMDRKTYQATLQVFDAMLRLLHPFMPFITEELWQNLEERRGNKTIMLAQQPNAGRHDGRVLSEFDFAKQVVSSIRSVRQEKNISPKEALRLLHKGRLSDEVASIVRRLANVSEIAGAEKNEDASCSTFLVGTVEFYIPLGNLINVEEELRKLQSELAYNQKFLKSVLAKLGNEKFVNGAPENVVALERKKQSDAESKIQSLQEQIKQLK
jgi:valyl-tRNA synthetase